MTQYLQRCEEGNNSGKNIKVEIENPDIQPTWPLLLKIEKGDEILKFFPLKPLGQLDSSFAKIILW